MAKIDTPIIPSRLFRYRSLEKFERELEAIERGYVFCSAYDQLNDPMEGFFGATRLLKKNQGKWEAAQAAISSG